MISENQRGLSLPKKTAFDETINALKQQFGEKVKLLQYPVNPGIGFNAIIDLIMMKMLKSFQVSTEQDNTIKKVPS